MADPTPPSSKRTRKHPKTQSTSSPAPSRVSRLIGIKRKPEEEALFEAHATWEEKRSDEQIQLLKERQKNSKLEATVVRLKALSAISRAPENTAQYQKAQKIGYQRLAREHRKQRNRAERNLTRFSGYVTQHLQKNPGAVFDSNLVTSSQLQTLMDDLEAGLKAIQAGAPIANEPSHPDNDCSTDDGDDPLYNPRPWQPFDEKIKTVTDVMKVLREEAERHKGSLARAASSGAQQATVKALQDRLSKREAEYADYVVSSQHQWRELQEQLDTHGVETLNVRMADLGAYLDTAQQTYRGLDNEQQQPGTSKQDELSAQADKNKLQQRLNSAMAEIQNLSEQLEDALEKQGCPEQEAEWQAKLTAQISRTTALEGLLAESERKRASARPTDSSAEIARLNDALARLRAWRDEIRRIFSAEPGFQVDSEKKFLTALETYVESASRQSQEVIQGSIASGEGHGAGPDPHEPNFFNESNEDADKLTALQAQLVHYEELLAHRDAELQERQSGASSPTGTRTEGEIERLRLHHESLTGEIAQLKTELNRCRAEGQRAKEELARVQNARPGRPVSNADAESNAANVTAMRQRMEAAETEVINLGNQVSELRSQLAGAPTREEREALETRLQIRNEELAAERRSHRDGRLDLQARINELISGGNGDSDAIGAEEIDRLQNALSKREQQLLDSQQALDTYEAVFTSADIARATAERERNEAVEQNRTARRREDRTRRRYNAINTQYITLMNESPSAAHTRLNTRTAQRADATRHLRARRAREAEGEREADDVSTASEEDPIGNDTDASDIDEVPDAQRELYQPSRPGRVLSAHRYARNKFIVDAQAEIARSKSVQTKKQPKQLNLEGKAKRNGGVKKSTDKSFRFERKGAAKQAEDEDLSDSSGMSAPPDSPQNPLSPIKTRAQRQAEEEELKRQEEDKSSSDETPSDDSSDDEAPRNVRPNYTPVGSDDEMSVGEEASEKSSDDQAPAASEDGHSVDDASAAGTADNRNPGEETSAEEFTDDSVSGDEVSDSDGIAQAPIPTGPGSKKVGASSSKTKGPATGQKRTRSPGPAPKGRKRAKTIVAASAPVSAPLRSPIRTRGRPRKSPVNTTSRGS